MFSNSELRFRLHSCLQTILELRDDFASAPYVEVFSAEFNTLSSLIKHMDEVWLDEDTVLRIEKSTQRFLKEFAELVPASVKNSYSDRTRLQ